MAEAMTDQELVDKVMGTIEAFYFGDGPESGEKLFNDFAEKHADIFEDDLTEGNENKLEYTPIYNEFVKMFEPFDAANIAQNVSICRDQI